MSDNVKPQAAREPNRVRITVPVTLTINVDDYHENYGNGDDLDKITEYAAIITRDAADQRFKILDWANVATDNQLTVTERLDLLLDEGLTFAQCKTVFAAARSDDAKEGGYMFEADYGLYVDGDETGKTSACDLEVGDTFKDPAYDDEDDEWITVDEVWRVGDTIHVNSEDSPGELS